VPVTVIPADINSDAAQAAIDRAQGVTALPLTITAAGTTYSVDSATLRTWITLVQTTPGVWDLTIDDAAVTTYINTIKAQVDQAPVDAEWHFGSGAEPIVSPSETGYEVDALAAVGQVEAALVAAQPGVAIPPIALTVLTTEPEFTTAEAQAAAGQVGLLGAWTTHYIPSTFNGNGINIKRPAALIDGTVIQAGDVFDFYRLTGPYTEGNGYTDGAAIVGGKTKGEGVLGGGLCSASTTVFNAALRAGFQMGARYNHGYYITRYPVGLDATIWVSGSSVKNMTFVNDSKYPIVIKAISKKRAITFQVWGVGDGRTVNLADPIVSNERESEQWYQFTDDLGPRQTERTEYGADGFDSIVTRTVRDANGNVIHSDSFRSDYKRVDGIVMVGRYPGDPPAGTRIPLTNNLPPAPGPTPTPTPGPETQPVASFTKTKSGSTVTFNAGSSTGGGLTYSWDFGDGHTGSGKNASHTYETPNTYTVTLTVTNSVGSDVATAQVNITGGGPTPEPTDPPPPSATPTPAPTCDPVGSDTPEGCEDP
jgi:vancomycin resistance protein YoaR